MVCAYGRDRDVLKVLDSWPRAAGQHQNAPRLTRQGSWVGTPGWMAPEQLFDGAIDARADLYSLGCVAYWLLSGQPLFDAQEQAELLRLHSRSAPARISERASQPIPEGSTRS